MSATTLPGLIDDSDAYATNQYFARADSTAVDLAPAGAEATSEIEAIDILEVITPGSSAPRSSRAPVVVLTPRRPLKAPSVSALKAASAAHPSSLAPMALDMVPPPPVSFDSLPSWSPTPTLSTTIELAGHAGLPRLSSRMVTFGTSVLGLCLVAGLVGGVLGYESDPHQGAATAGQPTFHAPRTVAVLAAHEETTLGPPDAIAKAVPASSAAAPDPALLSSAPPSPPSPPAVPGAPIATAPTLETTPARLPSAPIAAVAAAPHHAGTPHGTTGVLHVPAAAVGALVDGVPHRVDGGSLTIACGSHRVKLPGRAVRNVDVPCGGSASF